MDEKSWIEADVIEIIRNSGTLAGEALGLLDDCAVLSKDENNFLVISQDSAVEGVHFQEKYFTPNEIAHKVFHTTISDIAAMAAVPNFILLAMSLPRGLSATWINVFLNGLVECSDRAAVKILGGDTTRSPGPLFFSATAIGTVEKAHLKKRSTAKSGNLIAITGSFGYAALGLRMLDKPDLACKYPELIQAQKKPVAMIKQGIALGKFKEVTAMLDVSDGVLRDAENLCRASNLQAHIDCRKIPLPEVVRNGSSDLGLSALKTVLEGGEDYGLMVALDHQVDLGMLNQIISCANLTVIGYLTAGKVCIVFDHPPKSILEDPPVVFEHGE